MTVTLNPGDFVRVTLESNLPDRKDQPLLLGWNSREYLCEIGKETVVPLEAAINAFGDPRALANEQQIPIGDPRVSSEKLFVPKRSDEVSRLRQRYAVSTGYDNDFVDFNGNRMVPKVKVTSLSGEEIITVLDDPAGHTATPQVLTEAQNIDTSELLRRMQAQIDALTAELSNNPQSLNELPSDTDPSEVGIDPPVDEDKEFGTSKPSPFVDDDLDDKVDGDSDPDDLPDDFTDSLPN